MVDSRADWDIPEDDPANNAPKVRTVKAAQQTFEKERPAGRAPQPSASNKKADGLETKLNKTDLQKTLAHLFNGISALLRAERRFDRSEMETMAEGLLDMVNLFPPLRIIARLIAPVAVAGDVIEKARDIRETRKNAPDKPS